MKRTVKGKTYTYDMTQTYIQNSVFKKLSSYCLRTGEKMYAVVGKAITKYIK
jgi:hypothetical protein